jgi:hypothetical protein
MHISRMKRAFLVYLGCLIFTSILAQIASAAEQPSALALLRGVEVARTNSKSFQAKFTVEYILPKPSQRMDCLVEQGEKSRRFEIFPGKDIDGIVTIVEGNVLRSYARHAHNDVDIYDMERAVGVRGDIAFDPRILGLTDLMMVDSTVEECLWYAHSDKVELVGKEQWNGVSVWHIKVIRHQYESEADFWIEETSYRVHRKTVHAKFGFDIDICSAFDANDPKSLFPKAVHIQRKCRSEVMETKVAVTSFELGKLISPERFTLNSIGLPINTMINDYRIKRIVGYWDGMGISKEPTQMPTKTERQ